MDDPEFLTRSSPTRKRSEEEMRYSVAAAAAAAASSISTSGIDGGNTSKMSKVDEHTVVDSDQQSEDVPEGVYSGDASSPSVLTTNSNPGQSETTEREPSLMNEAVDSHVGSSQSPELNSTEEEPSESGEFEPYDDKPFDENVYAGNERPRCSIGIDDYSDSALGASTGDSAVSSGTSINDSSGEEKVLTRQRNSLSESELHVTSVRDGVDKRSKSDSEVTVSGTATRVLQQGKDAGQQTSSVTCIVEEGSSKPHVGSSVQRKAHSFSGSSPISNESPDSNICKFSEGMFVW